MVSTPTSPLPPDNHPSRRNKSSKHVVSPPPSILAYDDCHNIRTLHHTVPSNLPPRNWSNTLPKPLLGLNELSGVRVTLGVSTLGVRTNWWVVRRRVNGGVNAHPLLKTPAVA